MARKQGLKPIGDSIKKIIEQVRAERERQKNKNKPIRTQPKLPGMKKGGSMENPKKVDRIVGRLKDKDRSIERAKRILKGVAVPGVLGAAASIARLAQRGVAPKQKDPYKDKRSPGRPGGKGEKKDKRKKIRIMTPLAKKAEGGITGKTTFGELKKRFKPLKKGIRLKGKGSSFMKEYKKRVYNRAGGGSVNGGVRGTGIAVKGTNFRGVF
jgi:hypothetical protein